MATNIDDSVCTLLYYYFSLVGHHFTLHVMVDIKKWQKYSSSMVLDWTSKTRYSVDYV